MIVVLAIGGSIFGTILLSAEESTQEVTKYRFETEVTGLFPVDSSPEYYDYDLSRNYTGYYTQDTIINGVKYFGGASFTDYPGVNNYPVKYGPTNSTSGNTTIDSTLDASTDKMEKDSNSVTAVAYYSLDYSDGRFSFLTETHTRTISSLIRELELEDYDIVIIKQNTSSDYDNRKFWSFFGTDEQFTKGDVPNTQSNIYAAAYVDRSVYDTYPTDSFYKMMCRSIKVDRVTQTVSYYYDSSANGNSFVYTSTINSAVISYSTLAFTDGNEGIPISYVAYDEDEIDYMDVSRGVKVNG